MPVTQMLQENKINVAKVIGDIKPRNSFRDTNLCLKSKNKENYLGLFQLVTK